MPKVGMEPIRRDALIRATIDEIGDAGSLEVTVSAIARRAGMSSGLAHHYFGGKDQIFLAAMEHILRSYGAAACKALKEAQTPVARLHGIVEAGFDGDNFQRAVVSAWMNFYALALSSPEANRLLTIYQTRLRSNLRHALRPLVQDPAAAADRIAAQIDGAYLHEGLQSGTPNGARATRAVQSQIALELAGHPV